MGVNAYLLSVVRAANSPQTATWDTEWQRLLTSHPNWT
jgi:hypothetical protein